MQPARRADADQVAHKQAEIEATGINQQALSNVGVAAEVHATHPASLIEMGKGAFQALAAQAQQPQSAWAADASTIAVHGVAGGRILLPVPPSTIRFGDVTADAHRLEIDQRLVAVIALVADDVFDALFVWPHGLDLLGGLNQRLDAGRRVALVGILHGDADDCASLQIGRMLGRVRQVRPAVLHLRDLR
ncbi:MAG TPA: hypothetical protein VJ691_08430, partial [Vicinamibacterales bacterium]|nr:hypothetical protein [Vicinamibacterales bacterium]